MTVKENIPFAKAELYHSGPTRAEEGTKKNGKNSAGTVYNYAPTLESVAPNYASGNGVIPMATATALNESLAPAGLGNRNNIPIPVTACSPNSNNNDWLNAPDRQRHLKKMKKKRKKKTVAAGLVGGFAGMVVGGPIFAVMTGFVTVCLVKSDLKAKELMKVKRYDDARARNHHQNFAATAVRVSE